MPIYRYICSSCKSERELFCSISEKKEKEKSLLCERCGSKKFEQLFNTRFITDSGTKSDKNTETSTGCGSCSMPSCSSCGRF